MSGKLSLLSIVVLLSFGIASAEEIQGDLVIREDTVMEGKELVINGNLVIEEGKTLTIRNSEITINSRYKNEYWIRIRPNATLIVENSKLYEGLKQGINEVWIGLNRIRLGETVIATEDESSKLIMKNTISELRVQVDGEVEIDSSRVGIVFWRSLSGKLKVRNSEIGLMHIWFGGGPSRIEIKGLKSGSRQDLNLTTPEGGSLSLQDTTVAMYSLSLWGIYDEACRKELVVEDSELAEIFAVFPVGSDVELEDMRPQFYDDWNIYDNPKVENLTWNLTLKNVKLEKWKIDIQGKAVIRDSYFHLDTWGSENEPEVEVENSTIITMHTRGSGYLRFKDVVFSKPEKVPIRFLYNLEDKQTTKPLVIEFEHCTIGPNALIEVGRAHENESRIILKGNLSFRIPEKEIYWFEGRIDREYSVLVTHENGTPIANSNFILLDNRGNEVLRGTTNEDGVVSFFVNFTKENWNESWTLYFPPYNLTKEIGFLTDTPILITPSGGVVLSSLLVPLFLMITVILLLHLLKHKFL